MQTTWKPTAAGVLTIIAGCIGISTGAEELMDVLTSQAPGIVGFGTTDIRFLPIGIVTVIGGIYALRRKIWGLALAGAILAIPCMPPLGILALIFVSKGRKEFT